MAESTARWRTSRWLALIEIALVLALVAGDFYGLVPVTSTPFFLVLGWISLRLRGRGWRDVGFVQPRNWPRALGIGCLAGIGMELFSTFVTVPFLSQLTGKPPDLSDFRSTVGNLQLLLFWIALSWVLAAFGEELAFRGYVMNRIADLGQGRRAAWIASLVVTSALFGWAHGGQGLTGMLQEGFAGFLLGLVYLGSGRNLAAPIVAHGVANTMAFILIFFDRYPGV
ncbi:MAG TPA: type II CAAX endopeptidase family protein [Thermoanaerobaculia bacterium]|nr:type II CAAX endopeptidase family protein [Thermoanaerobaculia bacterium]